MTYQATIAEDGRLVFPAEVARELGLLPGDALRIDIRDGDVKIDRLAYLEQYLRRSMKQPEIAASVDEFIEWRREEARLDEEKWRRLEY